MNLQVPRVMKAIVYRGPSDLRLETVPVPEIESGELLVKVAVCGVCPTDIKKIRYGTVPAPRVFGHETAGVIVRVASPPRRGFSEGVHFRVGDRVALHHHVPCLRCHFCRHRAFAQCAGYKRTGITAGFEPAGGGYAEYVRVMPFVQPGIVKIPVRNTFEEGAMLEPVNTVLKAVKRLNLLWGDSVLVVGQGPIGLMFTKILSLRGIRVAATDMMQNRVKLALKWGAEKSFYAGRKNVAVEVRSAFPVLDAAVITVPSTPVVLEAVELVRGSAQILLFAHTRKGEWAGLDLGSICLEEKDLIGSYSADFSLQKEVARLVFSRKLDVRGLITHRFPLEQTTAAVALASEPTPSSLKVITWQP